MRFLAQANAGSAGSVSVGESPQHAHQEAYSPYRKQHYGIKLMSVFWI